MSARTATTVLPIQSAMAAATPLSWIDGIVTDVTDSVITLVRLDDGATEVRLIGSASLAAGEPVAYHPVAEILRAGNVSITARTTRS